MGVSLVSLMDLQINFVYLQILSQKIVDFLENGDTITVLVKIDNNYCKWSVRLYELDTCEMKTKDEKLKDLAIKAKLLLYKLITNI